MTNDLISLIQNQLNGNMPRWLEKELLTLQEKNSTLSNAQQILLLCKIFTSKIEITKMEDSYFGHSVYRSKKIGQGKRIKNEELMTYGAQLIYIIRQFLTDSEIIFHIATTFQGKYVKDAFIPQSEVVKKLQKVRGRAIGLSSAIENQLINLVGANTDQSFINKWQLIEELANVKNEPINWDGEKKQVDFNTKENRAIYAFQKQKADFNVYLRENKNKSRTKYYLLDDSLIAFNNGWLWEWYDSIYNSGNEEQIQQIHDSVDRGVLKPLFQEFDRTPGVKQGDYENAIGNQIQNKYNNSKIISYNNILQIIYELTLTFEEFVLDSTNTQVVNNLIQQLETTFIPESSLKIAEEAGKSIGEELIQKLNQNVLIKLN